MTNPQDNCNHSKIVSKLSSENNCYPFSALSDNNNDKVMVEVMK